MVRGKGCSQPNLQKEKNERVSFNEKVGFERIGKISKRRVVFDWDCSLLGGEGVRV